MSASWHWFRNWQLSESVCKDSNRAAEKNEGNTKQHGQTDEESKNLAKKKRLARELGTAVLLSPTLGLYVFPDGHVEKPRQETQTDTDQHGQTR
jgi:hypothetical protein